MKSNSFMKITVEQESNILTSSINIDIQMIIQE